MASKFLTGLAGAALIVSPTVVFAQTAPAPAAESISSEDSGLRGNGLGLAGAFFTVMALLIIFQDDLFGDDGDLNGPVTP